MFLGFRKRDYLYTLGALLYLISSPLGSVSVLLYLALTNRGKLNISCSSFSALAVDDNLPFLERMRSYMLPKHREFITAVRDGPSIKRYGTFRFYTF